MHCTFGSQSTMKCIKISFAYILVLALALRLRHSEASLSCVSHDDCKIAFMEGSECLNGFCTNPFLNGGCLHRMLPGGHRIRTCNSDDSPDAADKGHCRPSPMGYREVRIQSQEWMTAYFGTWILQILLGELLDIPVTVESGSPDFKLGLYDIGSTYESFPEGDYDLFQIASEVEDCTKVKTDKREEYVACSHVNPEYWGKPSRPKMLMMIWS